MKQLLKTEWLKIKDYRTFWVIAALFVVSIFGINYIAYQIQSNRPRDGMASALIGTPPFQFPEVWQTVSYMSGFLLFIPGLLIITSITNEYSFKTHRQNIIDGWSRSQFILVKMMLVLIIAAAATLLVLLMAMGFGLAEGESSFSFTNIGFIGNFFIQAVSYTSVALLVGLLLKRAGIAIGLFFLYAVVLENMLSGILNKYAHPAGYFLPLESTDALVPFPFLRNLVNQYIHRPPAIALTITALVYLALYFIICKKKFETQDL